MAPLYNRERETVVSNAIKTSNSTAIHHLPVSNDDIDVLSAAKESLTFPSSALGGCLSTLERLIFDAELWNICYDFATGHNEGLIDIINVL